MRIAGISIQKGVTGWQSLVNATRYSAQGLRACYRYEHALRPEVWAAVLVLPVGVWLGDTGVERSLLGVSWLLVLIFELPNSVVEAVVDRFCGEPHPLAGWAKDLGATAVMGCPEPGRPLLESDPA